MIIEPPKRSKHSYTQNLAAPPEIVFPLLCPVRESDWTPDWDPVKVISKSGVAEQDCMFITTAEPQDAVWIVTQHDPDAFHVQMYKVTPGHTVAKLEITLSHASGNTTRADVSYEYTALAEAGEQFLRQFTSDWYENFMKEWEDALNRYLTTGQKIS
jgi:hypothetical protein